MFGGIAVRGNLLCVSYTDVRGKLFLIDLEDMRVASRWSYTGPNGGYADAGGVAMDAAYNIFVADTANDSVRRFSAFGRELDPLGQAPERGAGSVARDRTGTFDRPVDVAVHGDTIYVCCGEKRAVRGVQRYDIRRLRALDHLRSLGDSEGRFGAPRGITIERDAIFVADTLHGVIQRFRIDGRYVCEVPTSRRHDEIARPVAVWPLPDGELLIADQGDRHELRRIDRNGQPHSVVSSVELIEPTDLVGDAAGRIYVLDRHGERVQRLHPDLSFDRLVVDLVEVGL